MAAHTQAPSGKGSFLGSLLAAVLMLAAIAAVLAFAATRVVQQRVAAALGPRAAIGDISVGWRRVELSNVTIQGAAGEAPVRARRVALTPRWTSFLQDEAVFDHILIEGFEFTVLRAADGDMQIAPALQSSLKLRAGGSEPGRGRGMRAEQVELRGGRLDFLDAVIARPAHRIPFEAVQARLAPLALPAEGQRARIEFDGVVSAGPAGNRGGPARVRARGWVVPGGSDADMQVAVRNLDIRHAAPYLAENGAASLTGGAMDLDMKTVVDQRELRAHGAVTLHRLQFAGEGQLFSLPREAVLAALKDRQGDVRLTFALSGNLDNPRFSVTRGFSAQIASGLGRAIGVGAEGAVEGVGSAVKNLGEAISDLFGQ